MFTQREGVSPKIRMELKYSERTKTYIIKKETAETSYEYFTEKEFKAERFFALISRYPIFLGGNAFLHTWNYIKSNKKDILAAAKKGTRSSNV